MRIGFDARYVRWDHHDGISRFSAGLAQELVKLATIAGHEVVMIISDERQRHLLPSVEVVRTYSPTSAREPSVAKDLNRAGFDIVFSPMQTMGTRGRTYRLILTVHDLIYYRHRTPPPQFSWVVRMLWRLYHLSWAPQRILLNRADSVVAVSGTTADLIREKRLTRRPVFVVPNAADATPSGIVDRPVSARARRIVYMGSFMPYKNVDTLVRAAALLPDWELHLLSRIDDRTRARLSALAPEARLVFHNGTPEHEYHELLATSRVLASASKDEGFGIPLIEAMAHGTPVVVSDIPIFHEVSGGLARYADVDRPETFARAIDELSADAVWESASQEARERAAAFSWRVSAERLLDVLERTADA